jgi:hypothetical protein
MRTRIGVRPSGPDGRFTRRDHLRGAGVAALVAVGLFVLAVIVAGLAELLNHGHLDGLYAGVVVGCVLGFLMAGAACLASLVRGAFARG